MPPHARNRSVSYERLRSYVLPLGATCALLVVGEALRLSLAAGRVWLLIALLACQLLVGLAAVGLSGTRPTLGGLRISSIITTTGLLILVTAVGVAVLTWLAERVGLDRVHLSTPTAHPLLIFAILTSAALAEELVFRGAVLFGRREEWGPTVALAVSTVAFAIVHIPSGPVPVVSALFTGWLWGLVAIRRNSFALPLATHLLWNWLVFVGWMLT